jgi:putative ABC transport system ATP-binding protein
MLIVLTAVTVRLGGVTVINDLSAAFRDREITAVTGPSGSGKTTLLGLLSGSNTPMQGTVRLLGPDGSEAKPSPNYVAWVPQGSQMLAGRSVLDNVMIGALSEGVGDSGARRAGLEALEMLGLVELRRRVAGSLSGGEAQRLAFARAIATSRPVLLADEPTANLDRQNAKQVGEVLATLANERTIVVATHDLALAHAASSIVDLATPIPPPSVGSR